MPRGTEAKRHSLLLLMKFGLFRKIVDILNLVERNTLLSPLEGEKKFLSELCELRNFREGYKKYKTLDRATGCAIVCVGDKKGKIKMNENNLQPKQPNNPATSPETNHSPLTIHHLPKRIAFTLAEVLITLGIIGVVAALTMPIIISKYKEYVFLTKFKQSYSVISQLYESILNDNGGVFPEDICNGIESENDCSTKIGKMLVEYNNNMHIVSKKEAFDRVNTLSNVPDYGIMTHKMVWIRLGNGAVLGVRGHLETDYFAKHRYFPEMLLDLNGKKGPNRLGYDQFYMFLKNIKAQGKYVVSGFDVWWAGGRCNNVKNSGETCAVWVIKHGNMDYLHRDVSSDW